MNEGQDGKWHWSTHTLTLMLTGGFTPSIQLGFSPTRQKAWSEAHGIVNVIFKGQFEMHFSPRLGNKYVPGVLPFALLITYPGSRSRFDLDSKTVLEMLPEGEQPSKN